MADKNLEDLDELLKPENSIKWYLINRKHIIKWLEDYEIDSRTNDFGMQVFRSIVYDITMSPLALHLDHLDMILMSSVFAIKNTEESATSPKTMSGFIEQHNRIPHEGDSVHFIAKRWFQFYNLDGKLTLETICRITTKAGLVKVEPVLTLQKKN